MAAGSNAAGGAGGAGAGAGAGGGGVLSELEERLRAMLLETLACECVRVRVCAYAGVLTRMRTYADICSAAVSCAAS